MRANVLSICCLLSRLLPFVRYGLFVKSAEHVTYQPNFQLRKTSEYEISLKYFKFIGRVFGKAIYDGQLLDAHFTRSFYKHMLGVPVSVQDMAAFDPSYHQSLSWILENNVADLGMDLTFTIEVCAGSRTTQQCLLTSCCGLIGGNIRGFRNY